MLDQKYKNEIVPGWVSEHSGVNRMAVPKLEKMVINVGFGSAKDSDKEAEMVIDELRKITSQRALIRQAKKSIAGFDLREGVAVGAKVTLRGQRMYQFADKLFNVVLPRVRDFRGLEQTGFDGHGNYSIGLEDHTVFLEIDPNEVVRRRGIEITLVTSAADDTEGREFLAKLGLPLVQEETKPKP